MKKLGKKVTTQKGNIAAYACACSCMCFCTCKCSEPKAPSAQYNNTMYSYNNIRTDSDFMFIRAI